MQNSFETYTVTRQDGVQVNFILDDHALNWEVTHSGEAYLLVVYNPFEVSFDDGDNGEQGHEVTYHNGHVVGVYYDADFATDAAEQMETFGRVPAEKITAADYLDAEGKLDSPKHAREVKGLSAVQYLNGEEPIQ